jgi:hypothetical protein
LFIDLWSKKAYWNLCDCWNSHQRFNWHILESSIIKHKTLGIFHFPPNIFLGSTEGINYKIKCKILVLKIGRLVEESGFFEREKHCLPHAFHQLLFCMEPDLLIFLYLSLFWTDKKHKKPAASSIAFFLPPSLPCPKDSIAGFGGGDWRLEMSAMDNYYKAEG